MFKLFMYFVGLLLLLAVSFLVGNFVLWGMNQPSTLCVLLSVGGAACWYFWAAVIAYKLGKGAKKALDLAVNEIEEQK